MDPALTLVTVAYGDAALRSVGALIESVRQTGVVDRMLLCLDRATPSRFMQCAQRYPFVEMFVRDFPAWGSRETRMGRKVVEWAYAVSRVADGTLVLCLDADTLIQKSVEALVQYPGQVILTMRESPWPVNSGVVFMRVDASTRQWLALWADLTMWMVSHGYAGDSTGRWGGVDQATLMMARAWTQGKEPMIFACVAGAQWNREVSLDTPLDSTVGVYHFKGQLPALLTPAVTSPVFAWWRECDLYFREA